jgi:hypothetical protein
VVGAHGEVGVLEVDGVRVVRRHERHDHAVEDDEPEHDRCHHGCAVVSEADECVAPEARAAKRSAGDGCRGLATQLYLGKGDLSVIDAHQQ